jgi:Flp pilus assembly protein TadG
MVINLKNNTRIMKCNKGAVAYIVGVSLIALIGFAAVAIDIGHLLLVRGELQNAADAGALAGAQVLYSFSGGDLSINTEANTTARAIAKDHLSDLTIVDVSTADVERGHWCFSCIDDETGEKGTFTANPSTNIVDLVGKTTEELDIENNFINAVRVYARRTDTPALSFFARIFGFQNFLMSAQAVAYRGFSGKLNPFDADQPIAICKQAITDGNGYKCSVGKMLTNNTDTAAWTNFDQSPGCGSAANPPSSTPYVCKGNPMTLLLGVGMGTTNGVDMPVLTSMIDCWNNKTNKTTPWEIVLPVINCPGSIGTCTELVGAVRVNVLWITPQGGGGGQGQGQGQQQFSDVPTQMLDPWKDGTWSCSGTTAAERAVCWDSFVSRFDLEMSPGIPATVANGGYLQKTVYFRPSCEDGMPEGQTGGQNFGVLAKIPVLVK